MAKITHKPTVQVSATFLLDEGELRALDALVGYGIKPFLEAFYEKMGRSYLEPHEAGLVRLFESFRTSVPPLLARADEARKSFNGEKDDD